MHLIMVNQGYIGLMVSTVCTHVVALERHNVLVSMSWFQKSSTLAREPNLASGSWDYNERSLRRFGLLGLKLEPDP